jgi:hypothetical protein
MKQKPASNDFELFDQGVKALHKALGPVKAHGFMGLVLRRKTDYVKISRNQYKGQTVDDIFKRAKAAR